MGIISEFKTFIARGNVIDLAVGVVMGGAFGKIVESFVTNIIMPIAGLLTGGVDFTQMKLVLKAADEVAKTPEVAIGYGLFVNSVISFIAIAAGVFLMIKAINKMHKPAEQAAAEPEAIPATEILLGEIRDLLAKKK
jgi:large conductance mechanosensitive channel